MQHLKMEEIESIETESEIFEGKEFLKKGDLKEIATILKVNSRSVYRVFQGTAQSDLISGTIKKMIEKRKSHIIQSIDKVVCQSNGKIKSL
ncbi:hypothetical protein SAMN04515674_1082 [Pseudarcicella hirudinis]|uniref:Uncharacterized protein n=1 Tax=Pseudarcicella hirudinis TaxID=1079859 RepID=A0A1I5UQ08_9BACT|nr:hypothetical protein [Pseudarcicella hirudinis]SFP97278.1 hypothetical protein SAMN04515674_1082 [Pseudarcicella hirudinis]